MRLGALLGVMTLALVGCGGGDDNGGTITDEAECQDAVHDYLVNETQDHPEHFKITDDADIPPALTEASDEELVDAIDRTSEEICDDLAASEELGKDEGVNIEADQNQIRASHLRQPNGLGL